MQESDQSLSAADHSHTHANKKRKMTERVVVAVKIEGNDSNKKQQRNEGPPSDRWSWRKYGQKPIKGSPYPRAYYRCSTSKGCSAKKQVERCKTDSSMLIITYTSSHNHPDPTFSSLSAKLTDSPPQLTESLPATPNQEHEQEQEQESEANPDEIETPPPNSAEDQSQFSQSPLNSTSDQAIVGNPFEEILQTSGLLFAEDPKPLVKSEENDFYDELEELPTSSFFTAFMKTNFCEERIAVNLS